MKPKIHKAHKFRIHQVAKEKSSSIIKPKSQNQPSKWELTKGNKAEIPEPTIKMGVNQRE
ncbi:hypothetical protein [Cytobacillus oceanisediminis]|uniref:Uncharacterized protein n=2 Tax=Cytobacillus oceanisediminis TaxID=665099 RepID=A0A160MCD0_9BACI|nr:hypothetical protein [Cytobacillus oceanisediminis]AND40354.1 hypothetical protein A361_14735 [Cytobacillus oceanisediminis 2691]MCM3246287.1 hypothetical protein [Cytobacillus oceanisediminis]OHX43342.1 hypothetical protein BBV17_26515 [Cytobacillus oceanisediminis]